jgi:hypothetical protein
VVGEVIVAVEGAEGQLRGGGGAVWAGRGSE